MAKELKLKNLLVKWSNGKAQKIGKQLFANGKGITLVVPEDQISIFEGLKQKTIAAIRRKEEYKDVPVKVIEDKIKLPYQYNTKHNEYHLKLDFTRIKKDENKKDMKDEEGNYIEDIANFIDGKKCMPKVFLGEEEVAIPFSGSIVDVTLSYDVRFYENMDCRINVDAIEIDITKAIETQGSSKKGKKNYEELDIDLDDSEAKDSIVEEKPKKTTKKVSPKKEEKTDVDVDDDIDDIFG